MKWYADTPTGKDFDKMTKAELVEHAKKQKHLIDEVRELARQQILDHDGCDGCDEGKAEMLETFDLPPAEIVFIGIITPKNGNVTERDVRDAIANLTNVDSVEVAVGDENRAREILDEITYDQLRNQLGIYHLTFN